ncbi:rhodanese-like domain-containing protein [Ancylomarina euxinus]|uniref:rhodanese-like domain-containing protein n=1 Tax=Ancylomarina euxinus TaxID=2283627 RepID=UPI0012E0D2E8|nr:rhodanese-like domain-containing protein [Ancylomarina euxinus]MCZ4693698.1 rhodanese-like domain-containing protein [Ancylomarina euxinus]
MYIIKRLIPIGILLLLFNLTSQAQKIEFEKVSARKFQSLILKDNNHLLIDVSRTIDHLEGHIPGAIFAETSEKLFSILDTIPISRPILIYCKYGKRSQKASWLIAEKYPHKVFALKEGIENWKARGFNVTNTANSLKVRLTK